MKTLLLRPIQLALAALVVCTLAALALLGWLAARDAAHLRLIQSRVERIYAVQEAGLRMQERLLGDVSGAKPLDAAALRQSRAEMDELVADGRILDPRAAQRLAEARARLNDPAGPPLPAMIDAVLQMRQALHEETHAERMALDALERSARTETALAAGALASLPLALAALAWLLRRRLFRPIDNLKDLLDGLAGGRFDPVPMRNVDPLLGPLFDRYNQMVTRLESLERAHCDQELTLANEVRAATRTVLEQSRSLARAERLAAVGELAATVAHELRNPLAGVQLALANLRRETPAVAARLDLVIGELQRVNRLLAELLGSARHVPEAVRRVRLAPVVSELLELARYQVPARVALGQAIPADLECTAPPDALKQALLNLLLNAVQALGDRHGTVTVTAARVGAAVHLAVRDDGPGFPAALLEGGVRPFASGRDAGTGLGLAVAQRFAREARGELELANLTPRGACALLRIPCAAPG